MNGATSVRHPTDILGEEGQVLVPAGSRVHEAVGCARCHGTGYRGRSGVFEVLEIDDDLRELIKSRSGKRSYRELVKKAGLVPLRGAAARRVLAGNLGVGYARVT